MCLYQTTAENQTEVLKVSYVPARNEKEIWKEKKKGVE